MLTKQFCRRVTERSSRHMATLVATEEFALTPQSVSQIRPAAVVTEGTATKGVKILSRYSGAPMTTLKFAIRGGSRAESLSEKGTQRVSGLRLIRDLETMGAQIASFADREKIVYEVTVPTEMADDAMARVSEAIASPPSAAYVINDLKGRGQIDYDALKESPAQQLKELKKMVDNYFVRMPGGPAVPVAPAPASPYVGGDFKLRTDLHGSTYLALGFPLPKGLAAKPYLVLHSLVKKIVQDKDSAITPFYYTYTDGGVFGFYANGAAEHATAVLLEAVEEFKAVATGPIDIEPIKFQMTLGGKVTLDGENAAELLLHSSMTGVKAKEFSDMSNVTVEEVKAAAKATLKAVPSYAILGTTAGTISFTAMCKIINA